MTYVSVGGSRVTAGFHVRSVPFWEESRWEVNGCRELLFRVRGPDVEKHVSQIYYSAERAPDSYTYIGTQWNNPSEPPLLLVYFKCPK